MDHVKCVIIDTYMTDALKNYFTLTGAAKYEGHFL